MAEPATAVTAASADICDVECFLYDEAALIDRRRFDKWLALFADDCRYWLPLEEGQSSPRDTVSLIYDDRVHLETRVRRLSHPRMHAQSPPSRTCHMVSNVALKRIDLVDSEGEHAGIPIIL